MIIRRYQAEDALALNALKQRAFTSGFERMRPDFWRWQYLDNPAGKATGVVAVEGDAVAGFVGIVPRRLKLAERVVLCAQFIDYVVAPESSSGYLAAGLLRRAFTTAQEEGWALAMGLTNANSFTISVHPRVGMKHLFTPRLMFRPLRGFAPAMKGWRRLLILAATGAVSLLSRLLARRPHTARLEVRTAMPSPQECNALWTRASRAMNVAFVRDGGYLDWRYTHHPIYSYHLLAAYRDSELMGWAVLAERVHAGVRLVAVVDWLTDPAVPECAPCLLRAALEWGVARKCDAMAAAMVGATGFQAGLRRQGYFPIPRRFSPLASRMVVRALERDLDARHADASQWFWTWGDSDVG